VALFVNRWSRAADQGGFNIAIVGAGNHADRLISRISGAGASCWHPIGIFDDRKTRVESDVQGLRVLGDTQDLVDYVRTGLVQQVVIALPWSAEERLLALIERLRELPVSISLGSDLIACHFTDNRQEVVGGARILEVERPPLSGLRGVAKWIEDKLLAGVLVLLFAPLMGLIALAVKLDSPGPALFRQIRYGFNNEQITIYKFRTMYHSRRGGDPFQQATKNDPRVTRVGSFLRRTSLDELPQLINVIEGRMSLIGPRPHPVALDEQYAALLAGYRGRFKMHPGITGWAQVNGWRGETESVDKMRGRVEHDLYYIENWSIWFDLRILWKTALLGWMHRNAY
jgi:Undecaprenyl-phosphate glucose phosphotransferase